MVRGSGATTRTRAWHARTRVACACEMGIWAWAACVRACDVRARALAAQRHVCGATSLRPSPFTHGPCRFVTSMSWPLKTLPPSILRLHAPRRAPSSPESWPWSAAEHPGRQRLLGACLAGFFAGALLTLLRRTQRRVESEQVCPPSHVRHSNHSRCTGTGMQALRFRRAQTRWRDTRSSGPA